MTAKNCGAMRRTARNAARAALVGACLVLSACGSGDENAKAINQAKTDLETLAATYQPGSGVTGKVTYQKVIDNLQAAANSPRAGEKTAARLLRARAYMRLGDEAAKEVTRVESQAQDQSVAVRAAHDQWLDLDAQAQALRKKDSSGEVKAADGAVATKAGEIDTSRAELTQQERELKSLQDRAAAAQDKARGQRTEEMTLRDKMLDKSQTERAELVKQANAAKRQGDGFDREAADLMADASRVRPRIDELKMRIQRLEAQKLMLEASKAQLARSIAQTQQQAERALKGSKEDGVTYVGAQQLGEQLGTAATELDKVRSGLDAPTERAGELYKKALGEAGQARGSGGGNESALTQAAANHALADLHMVRAAGLQSQADLMKLLAETKPALPQASAYATQANEAKAAAAKELDEAQKAFEEARQLYESSGASRKAQDVKERLESVAKTLAALGSNEPVKPAPPSPEVAQTPTTEPTTPKPADAPKPEVNFEGAQGEVFALLQKLSETLKAKKYEDVIPMIMFRNAQQEATYRKLLPILTKRDQLDEACRTRFGLGFFEIVDEYNKQNGGDSRLVTSGERNIERLRTMDPADLEIKILGSGDEAEIGFKSDRTAEPLEAGKHDGAWKLKVDYELEGAVINADLFLDAGIKSMDMVIEKIKSGDYGSDSQKMLEDLSREYLKRVVDLLKPKDENK